MSDLTPATADTPGPRHLQVHMLNGMISPVLRMEPGRVDWWWESDHSLLHIGPVLDCPDKDEYMDVFIPREHILMVQVSACTCDHEVQVDLEDWLSNVFNSAPPPQSGEEGHPEGQ